ncbi:MAG: hypothetical protein LBH00_12665 [Planctomycetaceae bacterium]|jgi:hypothetical protein|nr:hypothetical protein [Planctomycetaceae bacterium]
MPINKRMESQNRFVAIVPKSTAPYWLLFLSGIGSIALLEYAYLQLPVMTNWLPGTDLRFLDVADGRSLLNGLQSFFLLLFAAVSWVNFQLGIHFKDPYRQADVWFWGTCTAVFLSADVHSALHLTIRDILVRFCETALYEDGTIWWVGLYTLFFGTVGCRILWNMRASFLPAALFIAAVAGTVLWGLLDFRHITVPFPQLEGEREQTALKTALAAVSMLLAVLSVSLFARRQVFRDPDIAIWWTAKVWKHKMLIQKIEDNRQTEKTDKAFSVVPAKAERPVIKQQNKDKPAGNGVSPEPGIADLLINRK